MLSGQRTPISKCGFINTNHTRRADRESPVANSRYMFAANKPFVSLNEPHLTAINPSGQIHYHTSLRKSGKPGSKFTIHVRSKQTFCVA